MLGGQHGGNIHQSVGLVNGEGAVKVGTSR